MPIILCVAIDFAWWAAPTAIFACDAQVLPLQLSCRSDDATRLHHHVCSQVCRVECHNQGPKTNCQVSSEATTRPLKIAYLTISSHHHCAHLYLSCADSINNVFRAPPPFKPHTRNDMASPDIHHFSQVGLTSTRSFPGLKAS
eukprot:CAMPEP_0180693264 /NCGR_PEP_ID=MMETSP1038_2-20121128/1270_1 /TAXON_ID=632150 /ORGANISM="Azadinium spinosum, Strain 3D9" /LENGTH=142 /DNA_ID=CAMNT_0022724499 /DNA_START=94 /DNA_END=522 /DNA_ORIENTATION=-